MLYDDDVWRARLQALREGFDRSFALPVAASRGALLDLLAIGVGGERYALLSSEVIAVEVDRTVTPVPSDNSELLGVAGFRGALVAVYDLASLLGHPKLGRPRYLVLAKGSPTAFAFECFEGQLRVEHEAISRVEPGSTRDTAEVLHSGGTQRRLIGVSALVRALEGRARTGNAKDAD